MYNFGIKKYRVNITSFGKRGYITSNRCDKVNMVYVNKI